MHDRHGNVVPQPREVVRDVSSFDKLRWSEPHSNIALPREVRDGERVIPEISVVLVGVRDLEPYQQARLEASSEGSS